MNITWADRVAGMENPAVTAILKLTARNDIISFAGGLPSPTAFPVEDLASAFQSVLKEQGAAALQYGVSEGYPPLREWVAERLKRNGIACGPENIVITNGSQQALDLLARIFLNPGDYIAVENPTYLAALQPFRSYQARFVPVPMDDQGMDVDALAKALKRVRPKFIYTIPTFQNPTGVTMTAERRRQLGELAAEYEIPLVEDNPYGELRYSGQEVPAIKALAGGDWVIYTGTVSKIVAPGLRVGWLVAHPEIAQKMSSAKQLTDVLTNSLTQRALHYYFTHFDLDAHITKIVAQYKLQRDVMLEAMREHFPASAEWTNPDGGMFLWVKLPPSVDVRELLPKAIEQKVAYVPGTPFFADDTGHNTMRLSFANSSPEEIRSGIARLGALLKHV